MKQLSNLNKKNVEIKAGKRKPKSLIEENPQHPSLRTKKIQGTDGIFEASINMAIRVTFHYEKPDTIYLRNVGEHDITLKRN